MTVHQLIDAFYNAFLGKSRFVIYDGGAAPAYGALFLGELMQG